MPRTTREILTDKLDPDERISPWWVLVVLAGAAWLFWYVLTGPGPG